MARKKNKQEVNWKRNLREYWSILRKYKGLLVVLIIFVVLSEIMQVIPKFLFKEVVDKGTLFANGSLGRSEFSFILLVLAVIYLVSQTVGVISHWIKSIFLTKLETGAIIDLKTRYFNHILNLDQNFHTTNKTGSLIVRLGRGASAFERMTDTFALNFAPMILQLLIVMMSLAYFNISSVFVILIVVVCFVGFSILVQRIQNVARVIANEAEDVEKANVSDVFTNIDSVKYFGKEGLIARNFKNLVSKTGSTYYKVWTYYAWMEAGQFLIVVLGTLALLVSPIIEFLDGALTIGEIVFIYTIYGNLMGPMWSFVNGLRGYYKSMVDFQSLFDYGNIKSSVNDKIGAKSIKIKKGEIEFRGVEFGYKKRKVFSEFNLNITKNKKIAFVGRSGCGKSTLINLLYRFYDVDKGAILVDGVDIKDVKQESLRAEMAIVPQECVLFDDTIWNNIKFGRPRATNEEVRKAISFAQLEEIIADMPEKERTIVGERGVKLSGGEKQRVSIARAILADKKILVLDEATSALDSETEFEIQKDLEKLMKGRTSIMIAHRLSTIMYADEIVVLKKGKIVESGTHLVLLRKKGEYARLWKLQKGGYIK